MAGPELLTEIRTGEGPGGSELMESASSRSGWVTAELCSRSPSVQRFPTWSNGEIRKFEKLGTTSGQGPCWQRTAHSSPTWRQKPRMPQSLYERYLSTIIVASQPRSRPYQYISLRSPHGEGKLRRGMVRRVLLVMKNWYIPFAAFIASSQHRGWGYCVKPVQTST